MLIERGYRKMLRQPLTSSRPHIPLLHTFRSVGQGQLYPSGLHQRRDDAAHRIGAGLSGKSHQLRTRSWQCAKVQDRLFRSPRASIEIFPYDPPLLTTSKRSRYISIRIGTSKLGYTIPPQTKKPDANFPHLVFSHFYPILCCGCRLVIVWSRRIRP